MLRAILIFYIGGVIHTMILLLFSLCIDRDPIRDKNISIVDRMMILIVLSTLSWGIVIHVMKLFIKYINRPDGPSSDPSSRHHVPFRMYFYIESLRKIKRRKLNE